MLSFSTTGFARLRRWEARAAILLLCGLLVACVAVVSSHLAKGNAHKRPRSGNDIALYGAVIERVAGGEPYYAAAGAEQRVRGYPTKSLFNWRTPLVARGLAQLPSLAWAKAILAGLCLATLLVSFEALARDAGVRAATLGVILLIGSLLLGLLGESLAMPVVWSGALIAASLAAYGIERRRWGLGLGLAALFARELAGPYCAIACLLAVVERRWREAAAWTIGLTAYAGFYAWHVIQVQSHQLPTDEAHTGTWLQGGGLAFVIALVQVQAFLIVLPQIVAAAFFVLAMAGAAAANTPWSRRIAITLAAYVALFGAVGYDFNQYWGVLIAPLFALAAARAPRGLADLWRAAQLEVGGWRLEVGD